MTQQAKERERIAVTPPRYNTRPMRLWLKDQALSQDEWADLRWHDERDRHGSPMGVLTGVRKQGNPT